LLLHCQSQLSHKKGEVDLLKYLLRRFISGLILLFIFASIVFFAVNILLPGDWVSHFALALTPPQSAALRAELGLDLPLWQRYLKWVGNLLRGNLGTSFSLWGLGEPVMDVLKRVAPSTILVFGVGTALSFMLGEWLGRVTGWRKPDFLTGSATFSAITLYTSFPPWLAFLLTYFLVRKYHLFNTDPNRALWRRAEVNWTGVLNDIVIALLIIIFIVVILNYLYQRWRRKGLPRLLLLGVIAGAWYGSWHYMDIVPYATDVMRNAMLPLIAYVLLTFGEIMLIMRTTMVDTLHEEYINTARAKGLPPAVVRDRHAARNALIPVVSRLVVTLPFLMTGMVMLETALKWEGIGNTLFFAVGMQNVSLAMGAILVIGAVSLTARLVLEVLVVYLDPRLRTASESSGVKL
jgi:peptide/nickel transport system permease protein